MSITAPKTVTTPIPVQLSAPEFETFILPPLSMPKRGPKCTLGYYRVCNLLLWVLYTGRPRQGLPVPTDANGTPAIHYTTVDTVFATWAAPVAKKGAMAWATRATNTRKARKAWPSSTSMAPS